MGAQNGKTEEWMLSLCSLSNKKSNLQLTDILLSNPWPYFYANNFYTINTYEMKLKLLSILFLSGLILAGCNKGDGGDTGFFPDAPANPDKVKLVNLVNDFRSKGQSCGGTSYAMTVPVSWNDTLALIAKKHSEDMNANNKLNHTGSDGSFVDDRISAAGYVYSFYAENLLKGGATEEEAMKAWRESPAHCINLMDPKINEIGVGTSGPYWTMVLASH